MYAPFFGLQQEAFSIAPDPRFLFMSAMHREALAHLLYGLSGGGGFVLLSGEIGAGKTTVCRAFLEQIPAGHQVAYLYNPKLSVIELLQTICQEFGIAGIEAGASVKALVDALNRFMLAAHAAGRNCLLVIDEAQGLAPDVLEQLRLLTNLETAERKLLQIVLIGQPELREMLARPDLEQLAQRVIARVHLGPLNEAETIDYVRHRLAVAGATAELPFDARALALIHRASGGVPRRINLLCQRAMLGAYANGTRRITHAIVAQAAREVFGDARARAAVASPRRSLAMAAGVAAVIVAVTLAVWLLPLRAPRGDLQARAAMASGSAASAASASPALAGALTPPAAPAVPIVDELQAWRLLAARWTPEAIDGEACAALRAHGLACHQASGDWALLRKLDRPALLQLEDGGSLLLLGLAETQALVRDAGGERTVTLAAIDAHWKGRYATLWRATPGSLEDSGSRLSSAGVGEALARLTQLQGEARPTASREEALRRRVFALQVAQGLELDGVPGPITLMQLNRAAGIDEPRLRKDFR